MSIKSKLLLGLRNPKAVLEKLNELRKPEVVREKLKNLRIENIITRNYKNNPADFFFIQIGSNDGMKGDPIHKFITKYKWRGILVEPVSYVFKKLKATYRGYEGLIFENVAIAREAGYKKFYMIGKNEDPKTPFWYDEIGSLNKEIIIKHKNEIPTFDKHFKEEKIKCITLQNLMEKNNVKAVNLLHIDTEGYDYEIIKTINFNGAKPGMILYEHTHLSDADKDDCIKLLKKQEYKIIVKGTDTFAYL